jgi:hypothetical protein
MRHDPDRDECEQYPEDPDDIWIGIKRGVNTPAYTTKDSSRRDWYGCFSTSHDKYCIFKEPDSRSLICSCGITGGDLLIPSWSDTVPDFMGSFVRGDVLLAPVRFSRGEERKIRPVVVMAKGENGVLFVSPLSSRPPADPPWISLGMEDFVEGGLDLFSESYLLLSRICRITPAEVIGKKGRLRSGVLEADGGT